MRTMLLSCVLCLAVPLVWPTAAGAYTVAGCNTTAGPPVIGQQRNDRDESTDGRSATCSVAFNFANGFGESASTPGVLRNAASTSFAAGSYAFARARGEWSDRVTIVGPTTTMTGRPGRIYFDWGVEGRLEATGDGRAVVFARLMAGPLNQGMSVLGQASRQTNGPGQFDVEAGGRGVALFFVFDQPFDVFFEVDVTAASPNNFPVNGSLMGGSASARFGSTAWWGGISRVEDEFGNALDIEVVTDSGMSLMASLKPASPVPEPASWGLLLSGLGAMAWALRRRRRRLLLALACCSASAAQAQQLYVEGYACASECGLYEMKKSAGPILTDGASRVFGENNAAQSTAIAGFGFAKLLSSSAGLASSQAVAGFIDVLTVLPASPAQMGEFGVLEWQLGLSGRGDLQVYTAQGYGSVTIDAFARGAAPGTGRATSFWFNDIGGPVESEGATLPHDLLVRQGFVFGEAFEIGFQLSATTGSADAIALADMMNTALWGGIKSVSLNGVALAANNYSLRSASGNDYRDATVPPPVPEPGAWLLMAVGLVAVMWRTGHGRGQSLR